jgi:hypothetical protein
VFVIFNATILTMETGDPEVDLIREGVLTIRGGVIESVGTGNPCSVWCDYFQCTRRYVFCSNLDPSADHLIQDT